MNRISLTCVAVLASVAALASGGPAGWAAATELPDPAVTATADGSWIARVDFHAGAAITLGAATKSEHSNTSEPTLFTDVDGRGIGYAFTFGWSQYKPVAEVTWPVLKNGTKTGFEVKSRVGFRTPLEPYDTNCLVVGAYGKENPFHCSMVRRGLDNDWDMYITDGVDRLAEASGTITTDDSVSLDTSPFIPANGNATQSVSPLGYTTGSRLHIDGAEIVPANSSTQFDAVLTPDDLKSPNRWTEPDTARMRFKYAIRDARHPADGTSPTYYVRGDVSNYVGKKFTGGSSCEIVDSLDNAVENSGYSCTMNGFHAGAVLTDGRAQYVTEFTIGKKK